MGRTLFWFLACLIVPSTTRAQTPEIRSFTLVEAVDYARAHQPSLAAARARLEAAVRDASSVRAEWLPRVGAMAELIASTANNSTTTQLSSSVVDLPRIGGTRVS